METVPCFTGRVVGGMGRLTPAAIQRAALLDVCRWRSAGSRDESVNAVGRVMSLSETGHHGVRVGVEPREGLRSGGDAVGVTEGGGRAFLAFGSGAL